MSDSLPHADSPLDNPETWVDEYGDLLYRYAVVRLHNEDAAQDLVQETFLAALRSRERFAGKSSPRTWLIGILKHKLIDHIRKASREKPATDLELDDDPLAENLFTRRGHWKTPPASWKTDPRIVVERAEFRQVLDQCLDGLPDRHAQAFTLREMEELSSEDICKALDITSTNLWVILHRARAALRRCLEINWFGRKPRSRRSGSGGAPARNQKPER
jgi:RNA polymerase sigma-70 factor (ECF subfamily)